MNYEKTISNENRKKMLEISKLRDYVSQVMASLKDENGNQLFNYTTVVLDNQELNMVLKERKSKENSFLIVVMPQFDLNGSEDNAKWDNSLMFFIMDKTDYSEIKREEYIDMFVNTQKKAKAFVDKLIEDKSNHSGMFCNFLTWLKESSISVKPVWKLSSCNGWSIELNLDSNL